MGDRMTGQLSVNTLLRSCVVQCKYTPASKMTPASRDEMMSNTNFSPISRTLSPGHSHPGPTSEQLLGLETKAGSELGTKRAMAQERQWEGQSRLTSRRHCQAF